jgi:uncharacterized protein DUF3313
MMKLRGTANPNISVMVFAGGMLLAGLLSGCAQTVQGQPEAAKQMATGQPAPASAFGFFGTDVLLLQPGKEGQAAMVYVNPSAQFSKYNKILLEPVEFWDSANSSVSPADQHMLTAYFYNQLKENLQKDFTLVDQGGPGVLDIQVALVSASGATPVLRSVSVVIPQARILNGLQSLATGSYAFVGSAQAQMKATDAETGQLLAAAIDERNGGMALSTAAQWQWGDAENAMNYWAEKVSSRLLEMQGRSGTSASN